MFTVAIVGHSLLPLEFEELPNVTVDLYRKPGAKWLDIDSSVFSGVFEKPYDLVIFALGGNDLVSGEPVEVLQQAKLFINRVSSNSRFIRVYTVESRQYQPGSRFNVNNRQFATRRNTYNRMLKRWLKSVGHVHIDIGKPWMVNERTRDGVHFNLEATRNLKRSLRRVIFGVKNAVEAS